MHKNKEGKKVRHTMINESSLFVFTSVMMTVLKKMLNKITHLQHLTY